MASLLTVNEAAEIKNVTRQAIWAAIKAKKLATVTVKVPAVRIRPDVLAAFKVNPNMKRSGRNGKSKERNIKR